MAGIGIFLQQAREKLGYTLEEMTEITKIEGKYLQALEEDQFDQIPSPFYVRAFLKSYARKLHLNPHPLIQLYDKSLQKKDQTQLITIDESVQNQNDLPPRGQAHDPMKKGWRKGQILLWGGLVVGIGIAWGIYYFLF